VDKNWIVYYTVCWRTGNRKPKTKQILNLLATTGTQFLVDFAFEVKPQYNCDTAVEPSNFQFSLTNLRTLPNHCKPEIKRHIATLSLLFIRKRRTNRIPRQPNDWRIEWAELVENSRIGLAKRVERDRSVERTGSLCSSVLQSSNGHWPLTAGVSRRYWQFDHLSPRFVC